MAERNLDFDRIVDRRNTKSLKYDFAEKRGMPKNLLPLWVADMDFKTSSYVQDALAKQVEHGIFGYSDTLTPYFEIVRSWMKRHHDWDVEEDWLVKTPGIVFALAMAVRAFTEPGDAVLQQPVYYPFSEVISDNGRKIVSSDLYAGEDNRYHIDFEDFEQKIRDERVKLFFLCNPHNPVARVWTREELTRMGEICQKYQVKVVSDEIHADFVFKGKHQVFAAISKEFADFTITCTSPSKTFNLAGLQASTTVFPNLEMKKKFDGYWGGMDIHRNNAFSSVAMEAALNEGEEWLEQLLAYISGNLDYICDYFEKKIPLIKANMPDATYLVWLDCRALHMDNEELKDFMIYKAGLGLNDGSSFTRTMNGFMRLNAACPRSVLEKALKQLEDAVNSLNN